jgi:hypothetical protein
MAPLSIAGGHDDAGGIRTFQERVCNSFHCSLADLGIVHGSEYDARSGFGRFAQSALEGAKHPTVRVRVLNEAHLAGAPHTVTDAISMKTDHYEDRITGGLESADKPVQEGLAIQFQKGFRKTHPP